MGPPSLRTLVVVEDRHAEHGLLRALRTIDEKSQPVALLTRDALLAMTLRRQGVEVRLPVDTLSTDILLERDRVALDHAELAFGHGQDDHSVIGGETYGRLVQYGLIQTFMRAVGDVTAVCDQMSGPSIERLILVGGGPLPAAAALVARQRGITVEHVGRRPWRRAVEAARRVVAGRATKWVSSEFRGLVLEPAFLGLLFAKGLWRRAFGGRPRPSSSRALLVVGDRFTLPIVDAMSDPSLAVIVAGATQPGRALLKDRPDLLTIERFARAADVLTGVHMLVEAGRRAVALLRDRTHHRRFIVAGIPYWPLVRRSVALHALVWFPLLRHVQTLIERVAHACPRSQLLVNQDVTPYNRTAVLAARRVGFHSVGIQHGLLGEPNGQSTAHLDTLLIWGPATQEFFRDPKPRFIVTGNPRFDALRGRACAPRPQGNGRFRIVICTGFTHMFTVCASDFDNLLTIDSVLAWAASRHDVNVVLKIHPGEDLTHYEAAVRALRWDAQTFTRTSDPILHDLIQESEVLVTGYSTTVIEAVALGTRAIVFDAVVQRHSLPLELIPGVTIASSIAELHRQLDVLYSLPPADRQAPRSTPELRRYISVLDGEATSRVASVLAAWYQTQHDGQVAAHV